MEHKEKMENTAFADALIGALQKKTTENTKPAIEMIETANLPETPAEKTEMAKEVPVSISVAEINEIGTVIELDELRKKAQDEKVAVDAVGRKLFETRRKIEEVKADPNLKGTSVLETILATLRKDIAKLKSYGDENFQKRAEGFALIEEIHAINPEHIGKVREMYVRTVSLGYRRLVTKKEIDDERAAGKKLEDLIFFEGKISVSSFNREEKNSFHRALESEIRKLTDKAKNSKVAIIAAASLDLTGYGHGKLGAYQFVSPYHKGEDGREYFEGRALVKLFNTNSDRDSRPKIKVEVTKATGSLGWAESQPGKRPISLDWIRNGEIPPDEEKKMSFDQSKYTKKAISNLRRIYGNWKKGLNPEAAEPKDEKPEGPAVNAVKDTDMAGVIVETKPATAPKVEKPKKTTKKA